MDLELKGRHLGKLKHLSANVVRPDRDIDFSGRIYSPDWLKAMVSRPFLPDRFPGNDTHMWIDADAWIQDIRVVQVFVNAASNGALAIVPEFDRAFFSDWTPHRKRSRRVVYGLCKEAWGQKVADRLANESILDSGVFALRADAPHWQAESQIRLFVMINPANS